MIFELHSKKRVSQVALVVENPPANAGDVRDTSSVPGSGRSQEEGTSAHSVLLPGESPRAEEPGRPQSTASQRAGHDRGNLIRTKLAKKNKDSIAVFQLIEIGENF